jgi:phenylalanyl-tRNA synthetase beta subunit
MLMLIQTSFYQDVAIGYGFNNIKQTIPKCVTQGKLQPLNQFSDSLRAEVYPFFSHIVLEILVAYMMLI